VSDAFGIGIKPFFSGVLVVGHWRKHTLAFTLFYQVYFAAPLSPLFLTLPAAPVLPCCTGNAKTPHALFRQIAPHCRLPSQRYTSHTPAHAHNSPAHALSAHCCALYTSNGPQHGDAFRPDLTYATVYFDIRSNRRFCHHRLVTSFSVLVRSPLVNGLFLTSLRPQMCQFSFPICFPQTLPELRLLAAY
jgi:hypothetical protein